MTAVRGRRAAYDTMADVQAPPVPALTADEAAAVAAGFDLGSVLGHHGPTARGEAGWVFSVTTDRGRWAVKRPIRRQTEAEVIEDTRVEIPDMTGMTVAEAVAALALVNITLELPADVGDDWIVSSQTVPGGSKIEPGDPLSISAASRRTSSLVRLTGGVSRPTRIGVSLMRPVCSRNVHRTR